MPCWITCADQQLQTQATASQWPGFGSHTLLARTPTSHAAKRVPRTQTDPCCAGESDLTTVLPDVQAGPLGVV